MVALLLAHLALVVLLAGLRFAHDLEHALGFAFDTTRWATLSGVLLGIAVLAVRREVREGRAPWSGPDRAAIWLLLVVVPALHWILGDAEAASGADLAVLVTAGVAGWIVLLRAPVARTRAFWWGDSWPWPTGVAVITAAGIGLLLVTGGIEDPSPMPWLSYPLYALLQLGLLLELPERVWRSDGVPRGARVTGLSVTFALVHGPNPIVLGLTGLGMAMWAMARTAGTGLVPLALSMGLLGATVAQILPETQTQNMRVGPGYVIKTIRAHDLEIYRSRVEDLASGTTFARGGDTLAGWLDLVHLDVFGRSFDPSVREAWIRLVDARLRAHYARMTLESEEYRTRHGIERLMTGPERSLLYSTFRPWHPAQAVYDSLRVRAEQHVGDEDLEAYVLHLYRSLQGRTPSAEELAGWVPHPDAEGRREIVRRFLREAGIEDPGYWPPVEEEVEWPR